MLRGLYSAAGGMQAMSQQQDVTAHNLAQVMKPGYRREVIRFEDVCAHNDLQGPLTSVHTDSAQGILEHSGNALDAALNGPGFFTIQGPSGPLYTRNGVFQLNSQGQLVTPNGLRVQGASGPIALPQAASSIEILADGTIVADGVQVDRLAITTFLDPNALQRVGSAYFQPLPDNPSSPIASEVRQGYREIGNTSAINEMIQMISGSRLFEASQRALTQISTTIALNTRPENR